MKEYKKQARNREFASHFVPEAWIKTFGDIDADVEAQHVKATNDSVNTKQLKRTLRNSRGTAKKEDVVCDANANAIVKMKLMMNIIKEQKSLLNEERLRSERYLEQLQMMQSTQQTLEKQCESLTTRMAEMFDANAEKAHFTARIREAESAAMQSADETKRCVSEIKELEEVIRKQNKRILRLEKKRDEALRDAQVARRAAELCRIQNQQQKQQQEQQQQQSKKASTKRSDSMTEIDWDATYKEIDELRVAKSTNNKNNKEK